MVSLALFENVCSWNNGAADFQGPLANQTNLAIKGIIGLKSMSVISELLGKADKATEYAKVADDYLQKWIGLAMAENGEHLTLRVSLVPCLWGMVGC